MVPASDAESDRYANWPRPSGLTYLHLDAEELATPRGGHISAVRLCLGGNLTVHVHVLDTKGRRFSSVEGCVRPLL